jgi:hypothetical protein
LGVQEAQRAVRSAVVLALSTRCWVRLAIRSTRPFAHSRACHSALSRLRVLKIPCPSRASTVIRSGRPNMVRIPLGPDDTLLGSVQGTSGTTLRSQRSLALTLRLRGSSGPTFSSPTRSECPGAHSHPRPPTTLRYLATIKVSRSNRLCASHRCFRSFVLIRASCTLSTTLAVHPGVHLHDVLRGGHLLCQLT